MPKKIPYSSYYKFYLIMSFNQLTTKNYLIKAQSPVAVLSFAVFNVVVVVVTNFLSLALSRPQL